MNSLPPKLSVSFICADLFEMKNDLDEMHAQGVDYIHFDMMDGHFVPRLGSGTYFMKQLTQRQPIPVEVHLMVDDPAAHIESVAEAGASMVTFHVESGKDEFNIVRKIRKHGMKAGVALRPYTPIRSIEPLLYDIDLVLLMAFSPGILGQTTMSAFNERVTECRKFLDQHGRKDVDISVDGGVKLNNIAALRSAGVNIFVLGNSGLFLPGVVIKDQLQKIRSSIGRD
ncbi:MAG TPA: ribulose-phosphate 3-epimerase [Cyclobacteriaceae bacterium]|nr:ribulose-phosphate 3-epimerase [Cyclobacteriaceae bacterium]